MKLFSKCNACHKKHFIVKKRTYKVKQINQEITSQGELCRGCYKNIKKMISNNS